MPTVRQVLFGGSGWRHRKYVMKVVAPATGFRGPLAGRLRVRLKSAGMRGLRLAGACGAALGISLAVAGPVGARPDTTNAPAIFTVKVTLTDHRIAMVPNHAARGSTVTFLLTNRGKTKRTFLLGDIKVGSQGFVRTLAPNQQSRVVVYLNFRGILKSALRVPKTTTSVARGSFRVT